ncbi:hypothetical protein KKG72_01090 [bacterium]|nr:hypothetical protein [bacterium]MBU1994918.1 hypothetical protein [bacterium]
MKNILFFILFLTLPSYLFSKSYCIYIGTIDMDTENKSKIHSILSDVAHPSIKINDNKLSIYSGEFKKYSDANKLLSLTKTRYKDAKVTSCIDTKKYNNEFLFKDDSNDKIPLSNPVASVMKNKSDNNTDYCLKVFEIDLIKSSKQKDKIQYILNRLPNSHTKIQADKLVVYSGIFKSLESAEVIASIVKREFKNTIVSTCALEVMQEESTYTENKYDDKVHAIKEITAENFIIDSLDEKGLISAEIASETPSQNKDEIQKSDIRHAFDTQREDQFNGLYLKFNAAWDTLNSTSAYDARLEFDIFDQGYYQIKKNNEKNAVENKINFFKTLKNIEILKKEQELLKIKKYSNSIDVSTLLLKLQVIENNLNSAKIRLENGLITNYEYDIYELSLQQIKDELLLFKNMTLLKIPKNLWILLNQIENIRLIDEDILIGALEENSIDLKLAQTLKEKKPLLEDWSDKLRVNVYVGQRKMYLSQDQNLIGVEAKIPLSNYTRTNELDNIQNTIASSQVILQHSQTKEILKDSIATFKYKQQKLKTYKYELMGIKKHLKNLNIINNSAFALYANSSVNDEQKSIDNYLNKYTQIQQERINTYKELINIMHLIHSSNISDILLYAIDK